MTEGVDTRFTTPAMAAIFAPERHVRQMLAFEAALARAEADAGAIPADAAVAIAACCDVALFDVAALHHEAATAGTLAIPLVRELTRRVGGEAGKYVHWGATSQDVIDTALMLQIREGLDLLIGDLLQICAECADLAERHRRTLMAGRTLLQQALPITFGLKAARWLALVCRQAHQLSERRERSVALQFGGAAGTLAALGSAGILVAERLAGELGLPLPDLPWHSERDRVAAIAAAVGMTAAAMSKIAGDLVLLAQTEVGEAFEDPAPGKGGSSAMPQKRNPVDSIGALAAARLALGLVPVVISAENEHERGAGGWQAESIAIADLFRFTAGAVARVRQALRGLRIDEARMRANLDRDGGLLMAESLAMALAVQLGRPEAQRVVQAACSRAVASGLTLREAALDDEQIRAVLSPADVERALDPAAYLGSADALIDRALEGYRAIRSAMEVP
ncbi:MAG: 3-carboxy-cis,cis-muconate cycloisomerase [Herpetosiphonaceae bacterium]|nr:MAG: 3-carboxy-cis,cis-muconate cycloisomerase [Herpetosiphonaceae bacterium]